MTPEAQAFFAANNAIGTLAPEIEAMLGPQLAAIRNSLALAIQTNNPTQFQVAFQQLFNLVRQNPNLIDILRAMYPHLRPILGFFGCAAGCIELCCFSVTGLFTAGALAAVFDAMFISLLILAAVIVLVAIICWGIPWVYGIIKGAFTWTSRPPTEMKKMSWERVSSALNNEQYGPVYGFNNNTIPPSIAAV